MRLNKKLVLMVAPLLVIGGGSVYALSQSSEPVPQPEQVARVEVQDVPEPEKAEEPQELDVVQPTQQAQQTVADPEPEPQETLKDEVMRRTKEHAVKYELDPDQQWLWMDINISRYIGYDNEQEVRKFVDARLAERVNEDGAHIVTYWFNWTRTSIKTVH